MSLKSIVFVSLGNLSLEYFRIFHNAIQYNIIQDSTILCSHKNTKDTNRTHTGGGVGVPVISYNLDLFFFIN